MDVDVVVPSASTSATLPSCLASVAAAADAAGIPRDRITVVDDLPDRRISPLLQELGFNRVGGGGLGRSGARNAGAAHGTGRWLVFVDDDVELDTDAFRELAAGVRDDPFGVLGGLRPPTGAPEWLVWTYEDAVLTAASGLAPPEELSCHALSSALVAVHRTDFDRVGGFPEVEGWGGEDVLLGMALQRLRPGASLRRLPAFGGVHHFLPSFDEWLDRRFAAGRQLAMLEGLFAADVGEQLLCAFGHRGGPRAVLKRAAGRVPTSLLRRARGRTSRRVAAAAMETKGYRAGRREVDGGA